MPKKKNKSAKKSLLKPKKTFIQKIEDGHVWSFLFVFIFVFLTVGYSNNFHFTDGNLNQHGSAVENTFSDIGDDNPDINAILYVKKIGVMNGFSDGTFKPLGTVTRAEFMKILVLTLRVEPHGISNSFCFTDVKDEWFAPFVCYAKNHGFITGFKDGSFHPADIVTFDQVTEVINKAFQVDLTKMVGGQTDATSNLQVTRAALAEMFFAIANKK